MLLEQAFWTGPLEGRFSLSQDWEGPQPPSVSLISPPASLQSCRGMAPLDFAALAGYARLTPNTLAFMLPSLALPQGHLQAYLACPLSGWAQAAPQPQWALHTHTQGPEWQVLEVPLAEWTTPLPFRFITDQGYWIPVPEQAPNRISDQHGNVNWQYQPLQTGSHWFEFKAPPGYPQWEGGQVVLHASPQAPSSVPIRPHPYLGSLNTEAQMGVWESAGKTHFRVFAPRARALWLGIMPHAERLEEAARRSPQACLEEFNAHAHWVPMHREPEGTWYHIAPSNRESSAYAYRVEGENKDSTTAFEPEGLLTDPYAPIWASPLGPGIWKAPPPTPAPHFQPPNPADWVIAEIHLEDVLGMKAGSSTGAHPSAYIHSGSAPEQLYEEGHGRQTEGVFKQVQKWLQEKGNWLTALGVNAVELQPVTECELPAPGEPPYQWGYMPVSFFAPNTRYAAGRLGQGITDLQALVHAFHQAGLAVILDVVYNHLGAPNALLHLDKSYYFRTTPEGQLFNHSGCGNDFRTESPLAQRLIIDSLLHWIKNYHIDGFRFDLAELLGLEALEAIAQEVRRVKPDICLIAEPWSLRGHLGENLRHTPYLFWNDGYREFVTQYTLGRGNQEGIQYYLSGSRGRTEYPYQSVNYIQSHDDWAWIDRISLALGHPVSRPSAEVQRRAHLAWALLMSSLGTPMIAAGQDHLHTKQGICNTYNRPDLNQLSLERWQTYSATHEYCRAWIALRQSPLGRVFRLDHSPTPGYLRFFHPPHLSAVAALYNADASLPQSPRLLVACNPHSESAPIGLPGLQAPLWQLIADHGRIDPNGLRPPHFTWENSLLQLPALTCGVWVQKC